MQKVVGIYGASGFGREVLNVLMSKPENSDADIRFIDDRDCNAQTFAHHSVVTWQQFLNISNASKTVAVAIADSITREKIFQKCAMSQIQLTNIIANQSFVSDEVKFGHGIILQPFTSITSNAIIGNGFHANIYSYVAHDCIIGNFVTFAPSVKCNGNIHIGDHAYIGTGAIIRQGNDEKPLVIGAGAVIGMGAVVTKDVAPGVTVIGNPAKVLDRQ